MVHWPQATDFYWRNVFIHPFICSFTLYYINSIKGYWTLTCILGEYWSKEERHGIFLFVIFDNQMKKHIIIFSRILNQGILFSNTEIIIAAAAAKSHQLCPTLCDPIDGSPPGFPIPGILQARTLDWAVISSSNAWKWKVKVKLLSCVRLFTTDPTPQRNLILPFCCTKVCMIQKDSVSWIPKE